MFSPKYRDKDHLICAAKVSQTLIPSGVKLERIYVQYEDWDLSVREALRESQSVEKLGGCLCPDADVVRVLCEIDRSTGIPIRIVEGWAVVVEDSQ